MADEIKDVIETFDLNGKRLFKMSHGYFRKSNEIIDHAVADVFKKNNWIGIGKGTGKRQAENFMQKLKIGDYVYICDGGDWLISFARVTSDVKDIPEEIDKMIVDDGWWMYREVEVLFYPKEPTIKSLKEDHHGFMPSGYTTFWEVPRNYLKYVNDVLFKKNFGIELVDSTNMTVVNGNSSEKTYNQENERNRMLNRILYGPPGTGKTFNSVSHAVAIVENVDPEDIIKECESGNREDVKSRFDGYADDGLINFCTFHQSMSYEDFIEGIKPQKPDENDFLAYKVEDGIFKNLCREATKRENKSIRIENEPVVLTEQLFKDLYYNFVETLKPASEEVSNCMLTTVEGNKFGLFRNTAKSITIKSGEQKAKMSAAFNELKAVLFEKKKPQYKPYEQIIINKILENIEFTETQINNTSKRFVLIIDEINRGNVSQVFGELITLIEDDKRTGETEELNVTLPYSRETFGVPSNLYIIGTMNTADRSVEALDNALRRRFTFVPMLPDEAKLVTTSDGINLSAMLKKLNERLKILKDADHTIGHAWMMGVKDLEGLKKVFGHKILPLLQEYFYNDYEKLGLLLGERFFKKPVNINDKSLAKFFGSSLSSQYDNVEQYQLEDVDSLTKDAFESIYQ